MIAVNLSMVRRVICLLLMLPAIVFAHRSASAQNPLNPNPLQSPPPLQPPPSLQPPPPVQPPPPARPQPSPLDVPAPAPFFPDDRSQQAPSPTPQPEPEFEPLPYSQVGSEHKVCFWVASALGCDQKVKRNKLPKCRFDYFHVSCDGRYDQTDEVSLRSALQPGAPVCIVIHGSFASGEVFVHDAPLIHNWLRTAACGRPLNIIFYRWPSYPGHVVVPQISAGILGRRAELHGMYLAHLIGKIPGSNPISLLGHSHGARMAASALHLLGGGKVQGLKLRSYPSPQRPIRAVFGAAAIDHHWLNPGKRYGRAIHRSQAILNLRSRRDIALVTYPLRKPFSHSALGNKGFSRHDRKKLGCFSRRATEVDVTSLIGHRHRIVHYTRLPQIARAASRHLFFTDYQQPTEDHQSYVKAERSSAKVDRPSAKNRRRPRQSVDPREPRPITQAQMSRSRPIRLQRPKVKRAGGHRHTRARSAGQRSVKLRPAKPKKILRFRPRSLQRLARKVSQ